MGISGQNKVRWVFHFHAPTLLSEYVQEVGRAGRDGEPAEAMMLISEPTGWLDSEDKQRQQFFLNQERQHRQIAQELIHQIPSQGEVSAVVRQFKNAAIALSLLHSTGQLEWLDPFHYVITRSTAPLSPLQSYATQKMTQYLITRQCRWKFILKNFGFADAAEALERGCGHCDRCSPLFSMKIE
jgi:ATP-dependent DNA helicase RecQ